MTLAIISALGGSLAVSACAETPSPGTVIVQPAIGGPLGQDMTAQLSTGTGFNDEDASITATGDCRFEAQHGAGRAVEIEDISVVVYRDGRRVGDLPIVDNGGRFGTPKYAMGEGQYDLGVERRQASYANGDAFKTTDTLAVSVKPDGAGRYDVTFKPHGATSDPAVSTTCTTRNSLTPIASLPFGR